MDKLVSWMKESRKTVILTGAGMSTESGIPDFRSEEGLWKKVNPMMVARPETIEENYDLFHSFYKKRIENLKSKQPHKGYDVIAKWEKDQLVDTVVTQNVDDFHRLSGNQKVLCLHGSIRTHRCHDCKREAEEEAFLEKKPCKICGGRLRPNVVLFGESLSGESLTNATVAIKEADLVMVIGTSLQVYPVNQLPFLTSGRKVYINREVHMGRDFDLCIEGDAQKILLKLEEQI